MKRFSILALALAMFTGAVAIGFAQPAPPDSTTKKTTKKKRKARKAKKAADTKKSTN